MSFLSTSANYHKVDFTIHVLAKQLSFCRKKTKKMRESKVYSLLKKKVLGLFANLTLCQLAKKL
jgi:hypothetical protein